MEEAPQEHQAPQPTETSATLDKNDDETPAKHGKTQVLTLGNYFAERVLTPGNSESMLRARLAQATKAYLASSNAAADI